MGDQYPYIAEIRLFAGNVAPRNWVFCDGQLLSIQLHSAVFALIGTTYGGNGRTNFAVPDLRSRVPVHQGSGYPLAQASGTETVGLLQNQLPAHHHPLLAATANATSTTPSGNVWAQCSDAPYAAGPPSVPMSDAALSSAGDGQPHDNMPPFLALNFIFSLNGLYPYR